MGAVNRYDFIEEIKQRLSKGESSGSIANYLINNGVECKKTTLARWVRDQRSEDNIAHNVSDTDTNQYLSNHPMPAVNPETNRVMPIKEYCEYYGLPYQDVKSYKFCSHINPPIYNIAFRESTHGLYDIEQVISDIFAKKRKPRKVKLPKRSKDKIVEIISFGDIHIGMDTKDSLFSYKWNKDLLFERGEVVLKSIDYDADRIVLFIGGDSTDGLDGMTTRALKGHSNHSLPQNMDSKEQIDNTVEFFIYLLDNITSNTKKPVELIYLANSNHGGICEFAAGRIIQEIAHLKYKNVKVTIQRDFIDSYNFAGKDFILTHGKDEEILNRGFAKVLNNNNIKLVEKVIEHKQLKDPILLRYDLHQYQDTRQDKFRDILHPAFSVPSAWVSANFASDYLGGFLKIAITDKTLQIGLVEF